MSLFKNQTRLAMAYTNEVGDKIYPVIVDIKRGIKSTEEIQFMSSDINTGILSVAFIQGADNYNVSGAEVICSVMRPDASTLDIPCTIVENNIVEVPLGINGTSQDGVYSFDFKVFKGGNKVVGTPIMNYSVSLSISNDTVVEEDDRLPVLTVLMTQITALKNETKDVISTANTAIQNANKATDDTKLAISNAQSATQEAEDVIARVNNAIASGTQDLEVREARDGEVSLKARLDRDIEKAKQVYVNAEGSHISTDSSSGYLKDVEILGNTIQDASNLADIRSVGDKVEGQELYEIPVLSCGKNLFNKDTCVDGKILSSANGEIQVNAIWFCTDFIKVKAGVTYRMGAYKQPFDPYYSCLYSKDKTFIKSNIGEVFTPSENGYVRLSGIIENKDKGQFEEGTVATPYEPYQEDKLTILSPTPLEKVGDVADRIICKDGVWGVEKNVETYAITGNSGLAINSVYTTFVSLKGRLDDIKDGVCLCDTFATDHIDSFWSPTCEGVGVRSSASTTGSTIALSLSSSRIGGTTLDLVNKYLNNNPITIKYATTNPTFIPLPHDQQVKLRTFANKTNISFLTEIEGTIKAQVPKSLGATVNTHTTQIDNLNKELDRVKKLEESTVSTVETESDFTTVEATSNGYFEDVKLEGRTLVNLFDKNKPWTQGKHNGIEGASVYKQYEVNKSSNNTYHIIAPIGDKSSNWIDARLMIYAYNTVTNRMSKLIADKPSNSNESINTVLTLTNDEVLLFNCWDISGDKFNKNYPTMMILEGDHTQNPPSYFEGLKSVGQDVDEIVVSSANKNLLNEVEAEGYYRAYVNGGLTVNKDYNSVKGKVVPNTRYVLRTGGEISNSISNLCFFDNNFKFISGIGNSVFDFTTPMNCRYITIAVPKTHKEVQLELGDTPTKYIPPQSDKKQILFYNTETQTWEKPILREWDSIEKHADGKYYYHQRSGEVVLNGSEDWSIQSGGTLTNSLLFQVSIVNSVIETNGYISPKLLCDKFNIKNHANTYVIDEEAIANVQNLSAIRIRINKSKLSTQDVAGFKQWLQANNVTVVYQLAEEKVYECTNIDLITYTNETNYIVESGVISPKTTLKVHNNISNVVKILQEKVSLLENKFIEGLKQVLAGDMYSLAELLYPEDFVEENPENEIMLIPFE